ncbi:hypothetical protein [Streptomyces luteireticuli]|uniref:Uncharacterized protein n=1 Tax=Streptomyces luteireticuli TaxID=173858 RepID=A0ABP3J0H7_9ACTN
MPTFYLEPGVTGFRGRHDPPLPSIDLTACRTAWYTAARAARGRVGEFTEQEYPQNVHIAAVDNQAAALDDMGFVVLSAARLLSPITESDTSALSTEEWCRIKHWRPTTLGAALFNAWD